MSKASNFHRPLLLLFCWKLIGMPLAPGIPESPNKGLQDRSSRAGEEGP
jgi:hypothetical protein